MANYKKQLKDGDGNNIYPAQGLGTIVSDNIDWSTVIETVGSGDNICYKFPDGLMIAVVKKTASVTWGAWAGWYESQAIDPPNFAQAFTAVPFCVAGLISGGQAAIGIGTGCTGTGSACTATRGQSVVLMRPNDVSQSFTVCWQAIGRWK